MATFDTLLVANRGEIAVRIIRSARALGLETVAVFSEADRGSAHVRLADRAICIGGASPRDSYLRVDRVIEAAIKSGAGAIHPGYGFLSESADLADEASVAGLTFVGPTADQLRLFGQKHTARAAATAAGVPLLPGSGVLADVDEAVSEAERIGWPVMVKATGGGGGIGMARCDDVDDLRSAFESVSRVATANFGSGGVYLEQLVERARHVEVQLFGDGAGRIRTLGDRDCSLQRRNQKVIEEAPAPGLALAVRNELARTAHDLAASVTYRSAGTVEYVYDARREAAYFLEVNARLQVEHPVTEALFGVDLVAWMLRLANGEDDFLDDPLLPRGHAIEARIYAEDPGTDFRPSAGLLTEVIFPSEPRVDTWIETGTEITASYDPLLAKVIVHGTDREDTRRRLRSAIDGVSIRGIETNLGFVGVALDSPAFTAGLHDTATLSTCTDVTRRIDVLAPGTMSTIQDWPGRLGYWDVGVPPSGPMDDLSFRLGNRALGNRLGAPGIECMLHGPSLRFSITTDVCVTGAPAPVTVDGSAVSMWTPFTVAAGSTLEVGAIDGPGLRSYVLVAGGLDVPLHLGSASTFTLGGFGGHAGRALRTGDVLHPLDAERPPGDRPDPGPIVDAPALTTEWSIGVLEGPHGAPDFFTPADIDAFFEARWQVHFNSARTGVRLIGPTPTWARADGGEAGLHPSNIHDTPYAMATVDFTGDTPILLGPDGPSLGGFVCPATVAISERWKLGQLRPGDTVRFVPLAPDVAHSRRASISAAIAARRHPATVLAPLTDAAVRDPAGGLLRTSPATATRPMVSYRRAGEDHLLVEYGPMTLDFGLRIRVHSLAQAIVATGTPGIIDLTPGIRSLQIHVDPDVLSLRRTLGLVIELEEELPAVTDLAVSSRKIHLPLSWDDPATREAIDRYMAGVRDDAPWCPWNIEFIRRINGLETVEAVERIVHDAEYLVLGLGDVYLGAPVATPVDPRHRLVTTKYNPARTWTPENAVGIGGAYLCIYGMEGPGGYQFIGRTVPIWSRWHDRPPFAPGEPSLLRHFDRISWYPVSAEELLDLRADMRSGRLDLKTEEGTFSLADHEAFLAREAESINAFRRAQGVAFDAERNRWRASGEFNRASSGDIAGTDGPSITAPPGGRIVAAPLASSVWRVDTEPGATVTVGDILFTLEAMKLEITVTAPISGVIREILVRPGDQVPADRPLAILIEAPRDARTTERAQ